MDSRAENRVDWRALWAGGDLGRFCFISLGILLHATNETMVATVMPAMVGELSGVELVGWSLAVYELGAIVAGAAAGRLVSYVPLRTNMVVAALLYTAGALICATAPTMVGLPGRAGWSRDWAAAGWSRLPTSRSRGSSRGAFGPSSSASCRRSGASRPSAAR